jgi:pilus assembly protein CpaB
MKWAILGLVGLGVLAAMSAAFLVSSLRMAAANSQTVVMAAEPAEVPVLCASQSLQPMTVLDGSVVKVKLMPRNQAPVGCMTNPTDVVGKILATTMSEGEAFTSVNFTANSPLKQVASVIPSGMRAMGVSITDYGSLTGLLYPGSTVDVIGSFKVKSTLNDQYERTVSTTVLENIQVLAIEDQTVVSPARSVADGLDATHAGNQRITLLVTTHQAKALGLAMSKGTLALTLRNPLDAGRGESADLWEETLLQGGGVHDADVPEPTKVAEVPQQHAVPQWNIEVIRNNTVQTSSFPVAHPSE